MVSAILLHYMIDDPLPIRGTFGDTGSNPGSFFFVVFTFLFFFHMLSSFFHMLLLRNIFYLVCTVASWLINKKTKSVGDPEL